MTGLRFAALSLPDSILDGLCDIAKDSLKADKAYLLLYCGTEVQIVAECRTKEHLVLKKFPREFLNKDAKIDPRSLGNRYSLPRHLVTGSRDFTNLVADNDVAGVLMVGFDEPQKRLTAIEKEIVRRLAKTAVSHLSREVALTESARKLLEVVEMSKL